MPTTDEKHKYEEASRLILIKKWNAALPLLLDLIQTSKYYDSQDQTHYLLGLCYRFTYQIDKAIKSLEKCVGLVRFDEDPMYGSYYLALGIAYQQDGQYARAIDTFALGVQKDPNNHLIDNSIGLTFRLMGNYDRASQAYNHAHQILIDNALETLNIEHKARTEEYNLFIKHKDREISALVKSLKKTSPRNKTWWFIGGVVVGSAATYGAYRLFNER